MRYIALTIMLLFMFGFVSANIAEACPSCQVAMESSMGEDSQDNPYDTSSLAAAYNQSIYLFITMPYLLLGFFGFLIYRGVKQNEKFRQAHQEVQHPEMSEQN